MADYLLETPVFEDSDPTAPTDKTKNVFYPAGTTTEPTAAATKLITPLQLAKAGSDCGVDAAKAKAINLAVGWATDETLTLASPVLEAVRSANLGIVVASVNFSVGDATTLQNVAKTFIEVVTRRAVYSLGTYVFMTARTEDLDPVLSGLVNVLTLDQANASTASAKERIEYG